MDKRLRWLNNLMCFEVAARHQSYSKAAEELFISQAAVSQQMRQLESNLHVKLFNREARKMRLTEPGRVLLSACQKGFAEVIDGLNQVQEAPLDGELKVSSTQAFCALWLVPHLFEFFKLHPGINVNVQGSNRIENLHDGNIDVAIRFSTSSAGLTDESLIIERIDENHVYPVCSGDYLSKNAINDAKSMLNARLFSLAYENKVDWESWFEFAGVEVYPQQLRKTEVTSSDLALSAVLAGHGIMLASDIMVGEYVRTGQLVIPLDVPHPVKWKSHLVYAKNNPRHKRIAVFCQWVKENLARTPGISSL
ncbi:MAG: LysR family transcriptional regulator [Gammaproteobacteria bacterium]|nr:LysR family transcriptional regulator [Gammaproteobacteria bacterium]